MKKTTKLLTWVLAAAFAFNLTCARAMAAEAVSAAGVITKSAYNDTKVLLNNRELTLSAPLVAIEDESNPGFTVNYMPVRAVLESMGYIVEWDAANNAVVITSQNAVPQTDGVSASAEGTVAKAEYNATKVIFDGNELPLSAALISIVDEAAPGFSVNYMPVRAVLEGMGYAVEWSEAENAIRLTTQVSQEVIAEPVALRDMFPKLEAQGFTVEAIFEDDRREIVLTSGEMVATVFAPPVGETMARVVCGSKETPLTFIIVDGSSFVNEADFMAALKEVGFAQ
ncbi:MAG: copper amine oxidase N-terminal domain-containing protein [Clostridiales bacterium]|jgi:hypothetical protein|nr:copper amine oxidase N-terminal domain-containing protein [Clostridiales bacterium]